MLTVTPTPIPDVLELTPKRFEDERGFFSETWNRARFSESGVNADFVQDNHSLSRREGTVRGLHFQVPPFAQAKLVRCVAGRMLDVAVDLRPESQYFGRHVCVELGADRGNQLYIPVGFAHGFCTLTPDTEVVYKVSAYYAPEHDRGIVWNDPTLSIAWPVDPATATVSEKDRQLPTFSPNTRWF